jgi:hypothetical protein
MVIAFIVKISFMGKQKKYNTGFPVTDYDQFNAVFLRCDIEKKKLNSMNIIELNLLLTVQRPRIT